MHVIAQRTALLFAVACFGSSAAGVEPPRVLDPNWRIELIPSEPELVTPTGCCFDAAGRLLVVECHTHFPPDEYTGPKTDRIYRYDDSDGDGVLDRRGTFHEGGEATMNVARLPDGWFAVATRSEVVHLRDSDNDGRADQREVLLMHETKANYPHNGLGGLALGPGGWLYVGQGENLGESYRLIGTDGSMQIGGGEGGNVFRCRLDGSRVERVATGFWNPFGITFDNAERMWVVGNDPDSMPPNRLLHVVRGADFGFQFRFGRAGVHPLLAWNGEFPGTLPMVAGTGEAACAVVPVGDELWVSSWGDNRIERHSPKPRGASWTAMSNVLVQGDANFRPVGMAAAPDGSIYVTDWVDRSYSVHGKGRLWRLSRVSEGKEPPVELPPLNEAERRANQLATSNEVAASSRLEALNADDPFVRQAAVTGLIETGQLESVDPTGVLSPRHRVGLLTAWRWRKLCDPESVTDERRRSIVRAFLGDESDDVVLAAVRWATEQRCKDELPLIRALLDRERPSPRMFSAVVASIAYLETGSASGRARDPAIEKLLLTMAGDGKLDAGRRALALRRIPAESKEPSNDTLRAWLASQRERPFAREVVQLWTARGDEAAVDRLGAAATDRTFDAESRADALAGIPQTSKAFATVLEALAANEQPDVIHREVERIRRAAMPPVDPTRPSRDDVNSWMKLIGSGGSPDAGRRVFLRKKCTACHVHSGRGARTGPDLTTVAGKMTRRRVLESILQPSKEIGPLYVPWTIVTTEGKTLVGLKMDKPGDNGRFRFQGVDGKGFEIPRGEIEILKPSELSLMPDGLEKGMTLDELRDLVAFLTER